MKIELAPEKLQGNRVTFSRNGYAGHGIVIGKESETSITGKEVIIVAVNVSITEPQTYAHFSERELTLKDFV